MGEVAELLSPKDFNFQLKSDYVHSLLMISL